MSGFGRAAEERIGDWHIDGGHAWRTTAFGDIEEDDANEVRAENLVSRAAALATDLRQAHGCKFVWHCPPRVWVMIQTSQRVAMNMRFHTPVIADPHELFGLPVMIDPGAAELHIRVSLP